MHKDASNILKKKREKFNTHTQLIRTHKFYYEKGKLNQLHEFLCSRYLFIKLNFKLTFKIESNVFEIFLSLGITFFF